MSVNNKLIQEALSLLSKNAFEDALIKFKEAAKIKECQKDAYYHIGLIEFRLGKNDEAIRSFQLASELDTQNETVLNNLGVACFKSGKIEAAQQAFQKAILVKPDYFDALFNLAKVYNAQNKWVSAIDAYSSCLRIQPDHTKSKNGLLEIKKKIDQIQWQKSYSSILIIMEEGIGNMVMLTPAIQAIKETLPESRITVWGRQPSIQVIEGWHCVDEVMTEPCEAHYDLCFFSLWSSKTIQNNQKWLQTHCSEYIDSRLQENQHESESYIHIAHCLGFEGETPQPHCQTKKVQLNVSKQKKKVALSDTTLNHPAWARKRWPYYQALARSLQKQGYEILLIGGTVEAEQFNESEWPQGVHNLMGKYSVAETASIIKQCDFFVGNDSGPAHMAAALDIPTYVFFGSTLLSKNVPLGKFVTPIRLDLHCSPCQYLSSWQFCQHYRCMNELTLNRVLPIILQKNYKNVCDISIEPEYQSLQLVQKDYTTCQLVKEDGVQYVEADGKREPLRIHLVGAARANYPWGMENEILRAIELEGIEVIETDYRIDQRQFQKAFMRLAHMMLVCKGSGIHPDLIRQYPGKTMLWYQDDVFTTEHGPRDLLYNGAAFDLVYTFDQSAVQKYKDLGMQNVRYLPLAMSPALHRKMYTTKKYDVGFVGNIHPNRKPFFEKLTKRFNVFIARAFMDEMVTVFNESKIVINLGIGPTGIQQRVFEALGCGSLLITNEIPIQDRLFEDKKHLVYYRDDNVEKLIQYYLDHEEEREQIARQGYREVHNHHTFGHRIQHVLNDIFITQEMMSPMKATIEIGQPAGINEKREPKRRLLVFWHGIGDNVMATPALKAFREAHPDDYIGYMYLRRIHKNKLMEGCPYVDALHTCSDAWDDYADYETGVKAVIQEAKEVAISKGYDEIIPITMREMSLTNHRIDRIAYELGVPLNNRSTEIWISEDDKRQADKILSDWGIENNDFVVAIHRRGANEHKYWEVDQAQQVIAYLKEHYSAKIIAFETHTDLNREPAKQLKNVFTTSDLEDLPLKVSAAIMEKCSLYIGLDSGPMWMATTTSTPMIALFTMTWMHQSAPIRANSVMVASDQSWQMASDEYKKENKDRIVHDTTGGIIITSSSVIQAIEKLCLPEKTASIKKRNKVPVIVPYNPPTSFHQPGAYWGVFLTLGCSANCSFCIQQIVPDEFHRAQKQYQHLLDGQTWVKYLNAMQHRKDQPLALIGGEPSLHPDFINILNHLEGYAITITTNLISKHFKDVNKFLDQLNPICSIRFNTSFHPGFIEPEEYINRVKALKDRDQWVDQIAMVDNPGGEFEKYAEIFKKHGMPLKPQSFLGFHDGVLYPNSNDKSVTNDPREHGVTDLDLYQKGFSAKSRNPIHCQSRRFLFAPNGDIHNCHYHLYSGRGSVGNIVKGDVYLREAPYFCPDFGFCNPCDFPHVMFSPVSQKIVPINAISLSENMNTKSSETSPIPNSCPVCNQEFDETLVHDLLHCSECGFSQKINIPSSDSLKVKLVGFSTGAVVNLEKAQKRYQEAEKQIEWIMQTASSPGYLFDVGASGGFMMKAAQQKGWRVDGNEISNMSIQFAKQNFGFDLINGFLEELSVTPGRYDLVILWHSLEHSLNLFQSLSCVSSMLKPGGHVAVSVPLRESVEILEKEYEPFHHYEFSEKSLIGVLDIFGFELVAQEKYKAEWSEVEIKTVFRKK